MVHHAVNLGVIKLTIGNITKEFYNDLTIDYEVDDYDDDESEQGCWTGGDRQL